MIYIHTGQPGAGKTLFTLYHIKKRAESENRTVFYNGIPELNIPEWQEFTDAEKWHELPAGAIIVIDECQRVFRPRSTGKAVPESIAKFETHRHNGHDVYLITQHPMLVDQNIRRLAGTHRHIVRTFGAKKAFVHEWNEVKADCDRKRTDSSKTAFVYPKEAFGWYKSAEVHTHKLALPKQVYYILGMTVLLLGLLYYLYSRFTAETKSPEKSVETTLQAVVPGVSRDPLAPGANLPPSQRQAEPLTVAEYVAQRQPRISGLPHTAPVYDELTQPVRVPVPAACISMGDRCECYTQQATKMHVRREVCLSFVERGYFVDFDPEQGGGGRDRADRIAKDEQAGLPGPASVVKTNSGTPGHVISSNTWGGVSPRTGYQGVPPAL